MTPTARIATFAADIADDDVPPPVRELAKRHILDTLGLMVAGFTTGGFRISLGLIEEMGGHEQATLIGTGRRFSVLQAAYANGEAAHAMDYDDTQLAASPDRVYGLLMHPSAPILGAVLPVAEWTHATGEQLIVAFAIGVEVACTVADAGYDQMYSVVSIRLKDGTSLERQASYARDSPSKPMTDQAATTKFRECIALVRATDAESDRLIEEVARLERSRDVARLAILRLRPPHAETGG